MKVEGRIQTLTNLGLTVDQARIYLALLQGGPATARQLASTSKIARPDIYRIIPTVEKQGLVEKLMTKPIIYQAVSAALVLPIMVKHKTTEQKVLAKQTEELLNDLKCNQVSQDNEADTDSVMVYGKDCIVQRLKEAIAKAKLGACVVTSQERFSDAILEFADGYKKALRRGVKIKIAAEENVQRKTTSKKLQHLSKDSNFMVKYFTSSPPAIVSIFDNKEVSITMSTVAQSLGATALWSKNPSLVGLARSYFDNIWNNTILS